MSGRSAGFDGRFGSLVRWMKARAPVPRRGGKARPGPGRQRALERLESLEVRIPEYLIIHCTAGSNANSSVDWLVNPAAKASAHPVIVRHGVDLQNPVRSSTMKHPLCPPTRSHAVI